METFKETGSISESKNSGLEEVRVSGVNALTVSIILTQ